MASLAELHSLNQDSDLRNKITSAVAIKAHAFLTGTPTAAQLTWSRDALANPGAVAGELLHFVLAANAGSAVAAIEGASDAAIQANVDAAADALAV